MEYLSLKESAYKIIKEKLLNLEFEPGSRIREDLLAQEISMSRTPVREAINQLTAEGLVNNIPRKGIFVMEVSQEEINGFLDIREALETLAVEKCIARIDEAQIRELDRLLAEFETALFEDNYKKCNDLDSAFHLTIAKVSQNKKLINFLREIEDFMQIARTLEKKAQAKEKNLKTLQEHLKILAAIKESDVKLARKAIKENIETMKNNLERNDNGGVIMPRLSANLNFLFNEVPFMERFEAAAKAGFQYVEFMFPYDFDQSEIKKQLELHGLTIGLFNLPAGNWDGGDRGVAADPNRRNEFKEGVPKAIEAAKCFNVSRVNCLVGKVAGEQEEARVVENIQENILYAAEEFAKVGLNLMIEPVNHYDIPGFYLNTTAQVMEIIHKVNRPNVFLQYDIYHAEREGEDHDMILQNLFSKIGHIQIADNPGRNQPGTGVIPCKALLDKIDQLGYQGTIGLEYRPTGKTEDSLGWVKEYGYSLK